MLDFSKLAAPVDALGNLQATLKQIAAQSQWEIVTGEKGWTITIPIGALRKQKVQVDFGQKDEAGHALLNIWSSCGSVMAENALMLLRYNSQLIHGAFAIQSSQDGEILALRANLLADTADVLELTRTITAIAWQADRVEEQLLGVDLA